MASDGRLRVTPSTWRSHVLANQNNHPPLVLSRETGLLEAAHESVVAEVCPVSASCILEQPTGFSKASQSRTGRANTNRLFPALGRSSGVSPMKPDAVAALPVLTATNWRPSTA